MLAQRISTFQDYLLHNFWNLQMALNVSFAEQLQKFCLYDIHSIRLTCLLRIYVIFYHTKVELSMFKKNNRQNSMLDHLDKKNICINKFDQ